MAGRLHPTTLRQAFKRQHDQHQRNRDIRGFEGIDERNAGDQALVVPDQVSSPSQRQGTQDQIVPGHPSSKALPVLS